MKHIVRGYRSGVWYGRIDKITKSWIYLAEARQVRHWWGALDLSVLSQTGTDTSKQNKITRPVSVRVLKADAATIYECSAAAEKAFDAVPDAT